jgi:hypothetical protein
MAPAGDRGADVYVGMLDYFPGFGREQFLDKIGSAGDLQFLGDDAERILRSQEVYAGYALIRLQSTE